ncbi:MAG: Ribonuclease HII [Candidatus Azambacteria bacterium GW2011_GWE1_42_9]|nr:MAG: Ribonuclease HII [Candidatus Azambacteria bacterium GW2011_GWE1_42_9]
MPHIVGIDEAGRGPLAGPVAVGAVAISSNFKKNFFKSIKDSKKLSPGDRELWFALALEARKEGLLNFAVSLVSEKVIDRKGISYAIRLGIRRSLMTLGVSADSQVYLDGGIKAPKEFIHQLTVIRGDEKIPIISLASIMAKVIRDRKMVRLSKKFPEFNFHKHKGYGTSEHRQAIWKFGPSIIHRRSFLTRLTRDR